MRLIWCANEGHVAIARSNRRYELISCSAETASRMKSKHLFYVLFSSRRYFAK